MRLTFTILALIFFVRNSLLPLAADDYSYAFIWDGDGIGNILAGVPDTIERVDSISDLIASQWSHYMTWGGRTPAHTLIQIFVWVGKWLFDVLNTLMFAALIILTARLADVRLTLRTLLWITLGLWIAVPEWISTMEWLTGACNYLWMGVLQLWFLILIKNEGALSITHYAFLITNCLLAGWSNEAGGLATMFVAVCLIIGRKKIRRHELLGLLSFAMGYALLMMAPGNLNRLRLTEPDFEISTALLIDHLSPFVDVIANEILLLIPIAICLIKGRSDGSMKIFLTAGLLVPTVMMFSPAFPLRSCFMSAVFLLIASTAAVERLGLESLELKKYYAPLTVIGLMWVLSVAGSLYSDVSMWRQTERRLELIGELRAEPLIKVPPLNPTRRLEKFLGLRIFGSAALSIGGELSDNPKEGHNVTFAKYHGIKAIAVERHD